MALDRIQKIIAQSGLMSRRKAEEAILEHRIAVNGILVTEMGRVVDPSLEIITVDGLSLPKITLKKTYRFYKPKGILTTKFDPEGRSTIMDYFKDEPSLNPVGRLDAESEGLLLLTHDGDLLLNLTHPRYGVQKVYEVEVEGRGVPHYLEMLLSGVMLSDGEGQFDDCEVLEVHRSFVVRVSEGRNRFIRRMFGALGFTVTKLKRIQMGEFKLGELNPGEKALV